MRIICIHPESRKPSEKLFTAMECGRIFYTSGITDTFRALDPREHDILLLHCEAIPTENMLPFIERISRHIPVIILHPEDACLSPESLIGAGAQDLVCLEPEAPAELQTAITRAVYRYRREQHIHHALEQAQKMEAIGRMAGGIAHDYNNLLTVILNDAVLIRDSLSADSPVLEDVTEQISVIKQAAGLTRRLLMMARGRPLHPRTVDLNQIVRSMKHILRHVSGDRIRLDIQCDPAPVYITGDAAQIEQALLNLVINACDAIWYQGRVSISTGTTCLSRETDPFYLTTAEDTEQEYACLSVADTGEGIAEENCPRIFDPFYSTKDNRRGSGLGLYQVYSILSRHRGAISLATSPGQGTRINLFFACSSSAPEPEAAEKEHHSLPEKEVTVLLVEDDEKVRRSTRRLLEQIGYNVIDASGYKSARQQKYPIDQIHILISDVMMPDGSGSQLADELQKQNPALKVLLSSGYPEEKLRQLKLLPDKYPFLPKPLFRDKLTRTLAALLQTGQPAGTPAGTRP